MAYRDDDGGNVVLIYHIQLTLSAAADQSIFPNHSAPLVVSSAKGNEGKKYGEMAMELMVRTGNAISH
jgi:hypothetical protein